MQIASSASCAGSAVAIRLAVGDDGLDAQGPAGADDPERDLAPVGDQDPAEHQRASAGAASSSRMSSWPYSTAVPLSTSVAPTIPSAGASTSWGTPMHVHGAQGVAGPDASSPTRRAPRARRCPTAGDVATVRERSRAVTAGARPAASLPGPVRGRAAPRRSRPWCRSAPPAPAPVRRGRRPSGAARPWPWPSWPGCAREGLSVARRPSPEPGPNGRRSRTCQSPSRTSSSPRLRGAELGDERRQELLGQLGDARVVRLASRVSPLGSSAPASARSTSCCVRAGGPASGTDQTSSWAVGSSRLDEPGSGMPIDQRVGSSRSRRRSASPRLGGGRHLGRGDLSVRAERPVAPVSSLHQLVRREGREPVQLGR